METVLIILQSYLSQHWKKVNRFEYFLKKVMEKSLLSYQKQVDESLPNVKYFISLASSLY